MSLKMQWDSPDWLWLLPLLLVLALLWRRFSGVTPALPQVPAGMREPGFFHTRIALLAQPSPQTWRGWWPWLSLWGAMGLLVLALAQPVRIGKLLPLPPKHRDIVFIVDASVSMVLRDYVLNGQRISRMDLLRQVLDELVQGLKGDNVGVVVFGDTVHTLVPLTRDHQLVRQMLARIRVGMAGRYKALGDAITLAVKQAQQRPGGERSILVLFTDATHPVGRIKPEAAAELAAEAGLPVYTVAIGSGSFDAAEQNVSGLLYQPADLRLLTALARRTGADSYQANGSDSLVQAVRAITRRQPGKARRSPHYERLPLYQWPLLAAALLLLAGQSWGRARP